MSSWCVKRVEQKCQLIFGDCSKVSSPCSIFSIKVLISAIAVSRLGNSVLRFIVFYSKKLIIERFCMSDQKKDENLTPEQFQICRLKGTEPPFTGQYWNHKETGSYKCVCCNSTLF